MLKLISYFWPLKRSFHSGISGEITVSYKKGRKQLTSNNTPNSFANYLKLSEVALQRLPSYKYKTVLILGFGIGALLKPLKRKGLTQITGVEIDPTIVQLAIPEFNVNAHNELNLVQADAFKFVDQLSANDCTYDLIIIDLFLSKKIAEGCFDKEFWTKLLALLETNGQILLNAGNTKSDLEGLKNTFNQLKDRFNIKHFSQVMQLNDLYILEKTQQLEE